MKNELAFLLLLPTVPLLLFSQQEPAPTKCPDELLWTGKYVNHNYAFSFVIPENLHGLWNSARCVNGSDGCVCMQDHGRIIPLTKEPYEEERHIEVYAGYAADLEDLTVAEEVQKRLEWIKERGNEGSVQVLRSGPVTLAGLKGQRVAVRYYDKDIKGWIIEDFAEMLRGDVEYSLYLRTREPNYESDLPVFEAVLASFSLTKLKTH